MDISKILYTIAAAIFGWVFSKLPEVAKRKITWLEIISHVGLAAMVGLIAYNLATWAIPNISEPALCSIASVCGAACDKIMPQLVALTQRATGRAGKKILDQIGPDDTAEKQ